MAWIGLIDALRTFCDIKYYIVMIVANEREGSMLDNNQHLHVVSEIFSKSHKAMKKEAGNRNKWRRDRRRKSVIKQKSEAKHNDL